MNPAPIGSQLRSRSWRWPAGRRRQAGRTLRLALLAAALLAPLAQQPLAAGGAGLAREPRAGAWWERVPLPLVAAIPVGDPRDGVRPPAWGGVGVATASPSDVRPGAAPRPPDATAAAAAHGVPAAARGERAAAFRGSWGALLASAALALLHLPLLWWLASRTRPLNRITGPGFEIITHSERRRYIPLAEKYQQLDFVAEIKTKGSLRISANLNRVSLSERRYGTLMEDRNFRNALLVNRRRVRRTLLKDGDVLDLGDLTLLYRDNRAPVSARAPGGAQAGEVRPVIRFDRLRGPVRRDTPMLIPDQTPSKVFYISKNLVFLGRSETNDVVVKGPNIAYRHAKIERIGGHYKLVDLAMAGSTFVNNRRVEQRILKDGDEIALDSLRFVFTLTPRQIKERAQPRQPYGEEPAADTEELPAEDEGAPAPAGQETRE